MLWHVMSIYAQHNFTDFIIAGGYLISKISDWLDGAGLPWNIQLIDTGATTQTGGRLKRLERFLSDQFSVTYGDAVADVDIPKLIKHHNQHQSYCTVTLVHRPPRFGEVTISGDYVAQWSEKIPSGWINGGFFVVEPEALEFVYGDEGWEYGACQRMSERLLMSNYRHEGYWQCADYKEEFAELNRKWQEGAPWISPASA